MKKLLIGAVLMSTMGTVAQNPAAPPPGKPRMALTTTAFLDGSIIPANYTQAAKGTPVSPSLMWTNVPDGTVSFALILHDPDTSLNKTTNEVLHWMIFNIPGTARSLPEGCLLYTSAGMPEMGRPLCNSPISSSSVRRGTRSTIDGANSPPVAAVP